MGALTKHLQRDSGCTWFLEGHFPIVGSNNRETKGEGSEQVNLHYGGKWTCLQGRKTTKVIYTRKK